MSKVIQTLASGATIKEDYLLFLNGFLERNAPRLREFYDTLVVSINISYYVVKELFFFFKKKKKYGLMHRN
jgi:hypothetical protein